MKRRMQGIGCSWVTSKSQCIIKVDLKISKLYHNTYQYICTRIQPIKSLLTFFSFCQFFHYLYYYNYFFLNLVLLFLVPFHLANLFP